MEQASKYLILDTCIIQLQGNKQKAKSEAIINCIKDLTSQGYTPVISEFTVYENLHGLWSEKADEAVTILKSYEWKIVSRNVLILASMLGGLYNDGGYDKNQISTGDKIIAATAILENGLVLTENHKDFPPPFFITEKSLPIHYQISHYTKTTDLALYKPHIELIERRVSEKEPRFKK